jgi:hypothetical protein
MRDATLLRASDKLRRVSAIEALSKWEQRHLLDQFQERKFLAD